MSEHRDLLARLERHGQEQLLRFWNQLDKAGRLRLQSEIAKIDFDELDRLIETLVKSETHKALDFENVRPVDVLRLPRTDGDRVSWRHAAEVGESLLASSEVAVVLVAGGQGTRLGFDGPKGTYPIGPVSAASLFQIHSEKVLALSRRHGRTIPFYVMTSPDNHEATVEFFEQHDRFGLSHLRLFVQGQMPAVDRHTGKILLSGLDQVALSPDGHGGTLRALAAKGPNNEESCLDEMSSLGVSTLFYFQVDNPLVKIADPSFLGMHRQTNADVSFKVVEKQSPDEKVGVVVQVDGRPQVIEYSDLPATLAERRQEDGSLELWAGSIAIHVFDRAFVERLVAQARLPFHRALKKVDYLDDEGELISPAEPNAIKFETFIFDALPLAERYCIVETDRANEFEPLKNATGPDSPATVRQRMSDQFASWLERAGARVIRRSDGSVPFGLEISPLYALDAYELKSKIPQDLVIEGPTYLR